MRVTSISIMLSCALVVSFGSVISKGPALGQEAETWRQVYDPLKLMQLNLRVNEKDWTAIVADETFEIEVPALFWADGEEAILVSVRRKSADPIGTKVSLKIDINEYVKGQKWHDLKKISLENGDDEDVVSEGLAWYIHRLVSLASGPSEYSDNASVYEPGLAAWINLTVFLENKGSIVASSNAGVYVNVEQHDDQFLKNRGLWVEDGTWLYKHDERGEIELKEGDGDSDNFLYLNYSPFRYVKDAKPKKNSDVSPTPDDAQLFADLEQRIDMNSMLSLAAANAYCANPDGLFNHDQNAYFTDSLAFPRNYHAWDLDAAIQKPETNIYAQLIVTKKKTEVEQAAYQEVILNHPEFRIRYNDIMAYLISSPLDPNLEGIGLLDFLDEAEELLTPALQADPNSKVGEDVLDRFESLRRWVVERQNNVAMQLLLNDPLPR